MKKLIIIRHGKSSWEYDDIFDIDRPLKQRGIKNGYQMAQRLKDANLLPDLLYTSPAARALHTSIIFCRHLNVPFEHLKVVEDFYHLDADGIINYVKNTPNSADTLMIFGHNPVFTELADGFTKQAIDNVPTTGVVLLSFNINQWNDISPDLVVEEIFDYPKNKSGNLIK